MRSLGFGCLALLIGTGCSALINPDTDRLGTDPEGGEDAGVVTLMDAGEPPPPGTDAGEPPPGTDAGGPPPGTDAGCVAGCSGGTLTTCDGDVVTCPLGCAPTGDARCAEMIPSNVEPSLWRADARDVIAEPLGEPLYFDTSRCMARMADSMVVPQAGDAPEICVLMVRDFIVRRNAGMIIRGDRPVAILATGDVIIEEDGYIEASGRGEAPGPGGARGGNVREENGKGAGAGIAGDREGMFSDGGGGGGAFCGDGGDGGDGGSAGGGNGGGASSGVNFLQPLRGGSGGGIGTGGPGTSSTDPGNIGLGGAGGGALQISALGEIRIDGFILAGGGGGGGGGRGDGNWGAGGGGGSGGGVLLEAPTIVVAATAGVTTSGGGGAGSASSSGPGADGQDGAMTLGRADGGASGGTDFGASGGDSGGGGDPDGLDGDDNSRSGANGGGGGGGVGCVVYRTADGDLPANASDRTSGSSGPSLMNAEILTR